jgi:hypothetical protein
MQVALLHRLTLLLTQTNRPTELVNMEEIRRSNTPVILAAVNRKKPNAAVNFSVVNARPTKLIIVPTLLRKWFTT